MGRRNASTHLCKTLGGEGGLTPPAFADAKYRDQPATAPERTNAPTISRNQECA